tara:strand:- start:5342 stop:6337 length:996 start_codon:yes stop_codon:yes gene_type:complete
MNKENKNKYSIKECKNKKDWDKFAINSLNNSIFSIWDYINLEENIHTYFCYKKEEIVAGFIIKTSKDKKDIISPEYLIFTPILYRISKKSSNAKINLEKYEIVNFFCEYISKYFRSFDITFDTFTSDIRPFIWYGFPDYKKKVHANIRYTSIINLKNIDKNIFTETTLFKNFSNTLRQQYRYSLNQNFRFKEYFSKEIFLNLMRETFELQDTKLSRLRIKIYDNISKKLFDLNKEGLVKMFCVFDEYNNPINCSIFSVVNNNSTYMFSARSNKVDNKNYSGAYLLSNSFLSLKKLNINFVDLEGINSPQRGFYKLGFGGDIKTYYNIKLTK